MNLKTPELVETLALRVLEKIGNSKVDLDKNCWMILHEYHHGVMPSEYDIREVDEDLYLAVMKRVKSLI